MKVEMQTWDSIITIIQYVAKRNRPTTDHTFCIGHTSEKQGTYLYSVAEQLLFIDFKKPYAISVILWTTNQSKRQHKHDTQTWHI
jgi:hypothetical protein